MFVEICFAASMPHAPSFVNVFSAENSATGTRTRVARVRAEYPNQLDDSGVVCNARCVSLDAIWAVSQICRLRLFYVSLRI